MGERKRAGFAEGVNFDDGFSTRRRLICFGEINSSASSLAGEEREGESPLRRCRLADGEGWVVAVSSSADSAVFSKAVLFEDLVVLFLAGTGGCERVRALPDLRRAVLGCADAASPSVPLSSGS